MMGWFRKIYWRVAFIWGLLFAVMSSPVVLADEKLPPETAYLNAVDTNMADVKSLHYDVVIKAETPMGDVKITINGEGRVKPLNNSHDIQISYRDTKNKKSTVLLKQYIEESQGNLICYSLINEKWVKQIVPFNPSLSKELLKGGKDSAEIGRLQLLKTVKLKKETPAYKYMEVTLDSMKISDAIGAVMKQEPMQEPMQQPDTLRAVTAARLALLAAGDIDYTVKIDKAAKMVKSVEMDLTEPIQKGAGLLLDMANPKDKAQMEAFLAKSTLHIEVTYSQYNQIDPIVIPQDVRDDAVEFKLAAKEPSKKSKKVLL